MPLQPGVPYLTVLADQVLSPMQMCRQTGYMQIWDEVILIDEIPHRPDQTRRRGLRSRLGAQLDLPFHAVGILYVIFRIGAIHIFVDEREFGSRLMLFPSRTIKQVPGLYVFRVPPERSLRTFHTRIGNFVLPRWCGRCGHHRAEENG